MVKIDKKKQEKILEVAHKRFNLAAEANLEIRKVGLEDLEFRSGEQWPDQVKNQRNLDGRPCITINRLPQFIRQVTNDQRQNRPAIKISPVDDNADIETAKIIQGLIRHIEYDSNADVAYDTAFEGAVTNGFGYFKISTDYVSPMSFDQEAKIDLISNAFSVYLDPYSVQPDGSDAQWGFVFEKISKEDNEAQYGDSEMASMTDWSSIGDNQQGWATDDSLRIAEYYYKDYENVEIYKLKNNQIVLKSDYDDLKERGLVNEDMEILETRETKIVVVKSCVINAVEILEMTTFPGSYIPIIPVYGDVLNVDGKVIREGIVRHAKDPQRMFNYWVSSETETITLAPKAPFIAAEGQIEGYEGQWATANTKNHSVLQYKPTTIGGVLVPPPQRNVQEPPIGAITNARMMAADDMKSTTGIYDTSLGARSGETSGIAIQRRNVQSQTSNFHYVDNLTRALRHAGKILLEVIPVIYDTPRTARILGEDNESKLVRINEIFAKNGEQKSYKIGHGKYDVTIETGPSYTTKRQEATESMIAMSGHNPKFAEVAGDLMVKNMDWPGAQEIAERLKKTLPPGIIESDDEAQEIPQEAQQQMQQMSELIEQLTANLNEAQEKISTSSMEIESRERIAFAKIEADLKKTLFNAENNQDTEILKGEITAINNRLNRLGDLKTSVITGDVSPGHNMGQDL